MIIKVGKTLIGLIFGLITIISANGQQKSYPDFGIDVINGSIPKGLKVGDRAPDFLAYDQKGKKTESKKLLENGPVVIFFYGGKWSSVSNKYLSNYQDSLSFITNQGISLVAITPESIENVEQTVINNKLTYTVLYDCEEKIMKDYGVIFNVTKDYQDKVLKETAIDIAVNNGRDSARLPVPATYIISRSGTIVAAQFNPDYNIRASVKWVLNNLNKVF
jgi:peroxiredoxin